MVSWGVKFGVGEGVWGGVFLICLGVVSWRGGVGVVRWGNVGVWGGKSG